MTTRTTKAVVTFTRPFSLSGFDGEQPAGPYSVKTMKGYWMAFPSRPTAGQKQGCTLRTFLAAFTVRSRVQSSIPNSLTQLSRWMLLTPRHMTRSSHGARYTCRAPPGSKTLTDGQEHAVADPTWSRNSQH